MASTFRAFLALGAVFSVSTAVARTPDGQTPAEETVCDGYSGAAFGLCNAYCEAMDCDADPNADQHACDTVGAKFEARTGEAPPCDKPAYSCEDAGGIEAAPTEKCPAKEGYLQCEFPDLSSSLYYCDTALWDQYEPSTKFCIESECKVDAGNDMVCMDFGLKDVDGNVECRSDDDPNTIECRGNTGTVWVCDTSSGVGSEKLCKDTGCAITYTR